MKFSQQFPIYAFRRHRSCFLETVIAASMYGEAQSVGKGDQLPDHSQTLSKGRIIPLPSLPPTHLAIQSGEGDANGLNAISSTSLQYLFGQREVALDFTMLAPVNDGVKAHGQPLGMTYDLHQFRQLFYNVLPTWDVGLQGASSQSSDGQVAEKLIVSGKGLAKPPFISQ